MIQMPIFRLAFEGGMNSAILFRSNGSFPFFVSRFLTYSSLLYLVTSTYSSVSLDFDLD